MRKASFDGVMNEKDEKDIAICYCLLGSFFLSSVLYYGLHWEQNGWRRTGRGM